MQSYDEVTRKYNQWLSNAQKKQLQKRAEQISITNAPSRMQAQTTAMHGLRTKNEMLSNYGLASNLRRTASSGMDESARRMPEFQRDMQQLRAQETAHLDVYGRRAAEATIAARRRAAEEAARRARAAAYASAKKRATAETMQSAAEFVNEAIKNGMSEDDAAKYMSSLYVGDTKTAKGVETQYYGSAAHNFSIAALDEIKTGVSSGIMDRRAGEYIAYQLQQGQYGRAQQGLSITRIEASKRISAQTQAALKEGRITREQAQAINTAIINGRLTVASNALRDYKKYQERMTMPAAAFERNLNAAQAEYDALAKEVERAENRRIKNVGTGETRNSMTPELQAELDAAKANLDELREYQALRTEAKIEEYSALDMDTLNSLTAQLEQERKELTESGGLLETSGYDRMRDIEEKLQALGAAKTNVQLAMRAEEYAAIQNEVMGQADFQAQSTIGAEIKSNDTIHAYINAANDLTRTEMQLEGARREDAVGRQIRSDVEYAGLMNDDEKAAYNYYMAKGGEKAAREYLAAIQTHLNQRRAEQIERMANYRAGGNDLSVFMNDAERTTYNNYAAQFGETAAKQYLSTLETDLKARRGDVLIDREIPAWLGATTQSIASALASPMEFVGTLYSMKQKLIGEDIDPYDRAFTASIYKSAVREGVGNTIAKQIYDEGGSDALAQAAAFGYQTVMSVADNLLMVWLGGQVAGAVGALGGSARAIRTAREIYQLGTMSLGAASSTIQSMMAKGASENQALAVGFAAGAFEAIFEKISLDNLLDMPSQQVVPFLKRTLTQAGVEASEEFCTEIANMITNNIVMGDQGDFNANVVSHMRAGKTYAEAQSMAMIDMMVQIGMAAAGGFLSGGMLGGSTSFRQDMQTRRIGEQIKKGEQGGVRSLLDAAKTVDDAKVQKLYAKLYNAYTSNGTLSNIDVGRLNYMVANNGLSEVNEKIDALVEEGEIEPKTAKQLKDIAEQMALGGTTPTIENDMLYGKIRDAVSAVEERIGEDAEQPAAEEDWTEDVPADFIMMPTRENVETDPEKVRKQAGIARNVSEKFDLDVKRSYREDGGLTVSLHQRENIDELTPKERGMLQFARAVQKMGLTDVVLHDHLDVNGAFDPETNTMHIALDAESTIGAMAHELTHYIKQNAPEQYETLVSFLQEQANKSRRNGWEYLVRQKMRQYRQEGMSEEKLRRLGESEAAAAMCEDMLRDETKIREFVQRDMTLGEKVLNFLDEVLKNFKSILAGDTYRSEASTYISDIEQARKLWFDALQTAKENKAAPAARVARGTTAETVQQPAETAPKNERRAAQPKSRTIENDIATAVTQVNNAAAWEQTLAEYNPRYMFRDGINDWYYEAETGKAPVAVLTDRDGNSYLIPSDADKNLANRNELPEAYDIKGTRNGNGYRITKPARVEPYGNYFRIVERGEIELLNAGETAGVMESKKQSRDPLDHPNAAGDIIYAKRYKALTSSELYQYKQAKAGNIPEASYFAAHFVTKEVINRIKSLGSDVVLVPVISENQRNKTPISLARVLGSQTKNPIFDNVFKRAEVQSQTLSLWERMKKPYPTFDISDKVDYNYFTGKRFFLVDDNSTTGRTFNGLARFIQTHGGEVVGYYSATVGHDFAEKMTVTDKTWSEIEKEGLDNVRAFAENNGIQRNISRNGLSEQEARELLDKYRPKKPRKGNVSLQRSPRMGGEVRGISNRAPGNTGSSGIIQNPIDKAPDNGAFFDAENQTELSKRTASTSQRKADRETLLQVTERMPTPEGLTERKENEELPAAVQAFERTVRRVTEVQEDGSYRERETDIPAAAEQIAAAVRHNPTFAYQDVARNLDAFAKNNPELRAVLRDVIERPFNAAGGVYSINLKSRSNKFLEEMTKLGITTKAESAAVQRIGEGYYQDAFGEKQIYTMEMLQEQFPDKWENIVQAAELTRKIYDGYIDELNRMLEKIYPNVIELAEEDYGKISEYVKAAEEKVRNQNRLIWRIENKIEQQQAELNGKKRTDTQAYADLQSSIARNQARLRNAEALLELYEQKAAVRRVQKQQIEEAAKTGEVLRNRRVLKRADYFHHFTEMEQGFEALLNILMTDANIDPALAGKTATTKPKARYAGFMQRRGEGAYVEDAVNGMLRYMALAEYKLAFDPLAEHLRNVEMTVRRAAEQGTTADRIPLKNANTFLMWLGEWRNGILGKSSALDRALSDSGMLGRKAVQVARWVNRRVKSNAILGNARSAIVQVSNITNGTTYIKNPQDWTNGMRCVIQMNYGKNRDELRAIMDQSEFMTQRYMDIPVFADTSSAPKKFALAMLNAGDQSAAQLMWWSAYNQFQRNPSVGDSIGAGGFTAAQYADEVVRRSVGGRGVGELPTVLNSQIVNMLAPFQVEVTNTFNNMREQLGKKNWAGLMAFEVTTFALNSVFQALFGDRPLPFDFISALWAAMKDLGDDEEKWYTDLANLGKRSAGEIAAGIPFGTQLASFLLGAEASEKFFGEADPTRYGTGNMGFQAIAEGVIETGELATLLTSGKINSAEEAWAAVADRTNLLKVLMPWGGAQLARTIAGIDTVARGYSQKLNSEGELEAQFTVDGNILKGLQAAAFGKWSLKEAQEYIDGGSPMSAETTQEMKEAKKGGIAPTKFAQIRSEMGDIKPIKNDEGKTEVTSVTQKMELLRDDVSLTDAQRLLMLKQVDDEGNYYADAAEAYTKGVSVSDYLEYVTAKGRMQPIKDENGKTVQSVSDQLREKLIADELLDAKQKAILDELLTRAEAIPDYTSEANFRLSQVSETEYERAMSAERHGVSTDVYYKYYEIKRKYTKDEDDATGKDNVLRSIMDDRSLTAAQKASLEKAMYQTRGKEYTTKDYSSADRFVLSVAGSSYPGKADLALKYGIPMKDSVAYVKGYKKMSNDKTGSGKNGAVNKKDCFAIMEAAGIERRYWNTLYKIMSGKLKK